MLGQRPFPIRPGPSCSCIRAVGRMAGVRLLAYNVGVRVVRPRLRLGARSCMGVSAASVLSELLRRCAAVLPPSCRSNRQGNLTACALALSDLSDASIRLLLTSRALKAEQQGSTCVKHAPMDLAQSALLSVPVGAVDCASPPGCRLLGARGFQWNTA